MPLDGLQGLAVDWPAPAGVQAFMSMRHGGVSRGPYASLNLGAHVGDDAADVHENRRRLALALGAAPKWLNQIHGAGVVPAHALADGAPVAADAVYADQPGQACAVLVADCLPVLFCSTDGRVVAAAHAGWRGLAAGVLENTVHALCATAHRPADQILAWLGPCIGPRQFEVGADVLQAFGGENSPHFVPHRPDRWLCDLPGLARRRLHAAGVRSVHGGHWCTVEQGSDFFSFRRDRVTGRMAAVISLRG